MKQVIMTVVATVALVGCASYSSGELQSATATQLQAANIGPFPENYQSLIRAHMVDVLRVPDAARYTFNTQPLRVGRGPSPEQLNFRWEVPFKVNSKNAWGAYTGDKEYIVHIQQGQVTNLFRGRADEERFDRLR